MINSLFSLSGIDPAGLNYRNVSDSQRISTRSGKLVEIVHTSSEWGLIEAVGHIDFYVNGGMRQPSCKPLMSHVLCSHVLGYEYWIAAVKNPRSFVGVRCSDNNQFLKEQCDYTIKAYMAENYFLNQHFKKGKYYLQTRNSPPYGLGEQGTKPVNGEDLIGTLVPDGTVELAKSWAEQVVDKLSSIFAL